MHGYFTNGGYPTNGQLIFSGASDWFVIQTDESFNGQRGHTNPLYEGNFLGWYSSNAFGGTNYSHTPVGAISNVQEPNAIAGDPYLYFGLWASGKPFAYCAWNSLKGTNGGTALFMQAVGDPFTKY